MNNFLTNALPVADWVENFTDWLTNTFGGLFSLLQTIGQGVMDGMTNLLGLVPPLLFIAILTIFAYIVGNRKFGLPTFTLLGLLFIYNQGIWDELLSTVTLVLVASLVSIIIGIPLGILAAKSNKAQSIITPILDFMQTMPGFVYLIPAVAFFGIGMVPGVFASVIFALPPTVRFTNLGIRQVPKELVEASDSFGGTGWQKLTKLEIPLAKKTILAGINQTIMLALSMVVTASMIGAPGLGRGVLSALQRAQVGNGFVNGLALVILAIIIDRFTLFFNRKQEGGANKNNQKRNKLLVIGLVVVLVGGTLVNLFKSGNDDKQVNLSYVEWDTEVASTNVIAEVLRQQGYEVTITPLDNAIMWESVATGETDGMVAAWLPITHASMWEKHQDGVEDLGANLVGAKIGLVVPSYMEADSIADLTTEAKQKITGIEPGASMMTAVENTIDLYPNLKDWGLVASSSGAMTAALDQAVKKQEEIVITGWSPHWMFAKYDLKYLEDPLKGVETNEEIHTVVRKGLEEEQPEVYHILDNFYWEKMDIEEVMLAIQQGQDPQEAARDWIEKNQETVNSWLE